MLQNKLDVFFAEYFLWNIKIKKNLGDLLYLLNDAGEKNWWLISEESNATLHLSIREDKTYKIQRIVSTNQQTCYHSILQLVLYQVGILIPHFRSLRENGYKLWVHWFLGRLRWKSVSYDWSMVFKATINQSQVTFVHPNNPRDRCAEILNPFLLKSLWIIKWGIGIQYWIKKNTVIPYSNKKKKKTWMIGLVFEENLRLDYSGS